MFSGSSNALLVAGSPPRPVVRTAAALVATSGGPTSLRRHGWSQMVAATNQGCTSPLSAGPLLNPFAVPVDLVRPSPAAVASFPRCPPLSATVAGDGQPVAATSCINCSALFPCPLRTSSSSLSPPLLACSLPSRPSTASFARGPPSPSPSPTPSPLFLFFSRFARQNNFGAKKSKFQSFAPNFLTVF